MAPINPGETPYTPPVAKPERVKAVIDTTVEPVITAGGRHAWYQTVNAGRVRKPLGN